MSDSRRRSLLTTALVGALLPADVPEGHMLRSWLDSWSGVGHVLDAMTAAGHHVELRQSVFGWRAEFYREAMQHSRSATCCMRKEAWWGRCRARHPHRDHHPTRRDLHVGRRLACHEQAEVRTSFVDSFALEGLADPVAVYRVEQTHRMRVISESVDRAHGSAGLRSDRRGGLRCPHRELDRPFLPVPSEQLAAHQRQRTTLFSIPRGDSANAE